MKIWDYLAVTPTQFQTDYVDTRLVDVAKHPQFPLQLLCYGREAVHTNNWDAVIRKCRGVIYNIETEEIIARPFEKFFNLGTAGMPETDPEDWHFDGNGIPDGCVPEVWEKMDGFLCTLYSYNGESYIASKGSFDSPHAKWATAWYRAHVTGHWPKGYTPMFEGITPNIRIVVDYGKREGLALLALINIETGEELAIHNIRVYAEVNGVTYPRLHTMGWQAARTESLDPDVKNVEGYVLVWRRPGTTPFRLKVKYVDYLRLHHMVSGVSAKAIYNCLAGNEYKGDLNEWINESNPWFSKFVSKWVRALTTRHDELMRRATKTFEALRAIAIEDTRLYARIWTRKEWAERFLASGNKEISGLLFAMLDGKDASAVAWKLTKPMITGSQPMVHGRDLL